MLDCLLLDGVAGRWQPRAVFTQAVQSLLLHQKLEKWQSRRTCPAHTLASLLVLRLPWASLICALPTLAMHCTAAAACG